MFKPVLCVRFDNESHVFPCTIQNKTYLAVPIFLAALYILRFEQRFQIILVFAFSGREMVFFRAV